MKKILSLSFLILAFSTHLQASTSKFYKNAEGCIVEVEKTENGTLYYVKSADDQLATVGILNNKSSGDIASFCSDGEVDLEGRKLTLTCSPQKESGSVTTRGRAILDTTDGLSALKVKGEVKKFLGWKIDTNISCISLSEVPAIL